MKFQILTTSLILFFFAWWPAPGSGPIVDVNRFIGEQDEIERIGRHWRRTVADLSSGTKISWEKYPGVEVVLTGEEYCFRDKMPTGNKWMIVGSNRSYAFWLTEHGTDFRIRDLAVDSKDDNESSQAAGMAQHGKKYYSRWPFQLTAPFMGSFLPLNEAIQDEKFKIVSTKSSVLNGVDCVQFDWNFDGGTNAFPQVGKFWVSRDAIPNLLAIDWEHQIENAVRVVGTCRFSDFRQFRNSELPCRYDFVTKVGTTESQSGSFEVTYAGDFDDGIFFLSHYGLPEPPEFRSNRAWRASALVLFAIVFAVTAYYVKSIRKR
jgi:hypothetical protein